MDFLTTEEFSEIAELSSFEVFSSPYAYLAYEGSQRLPSAEELVCVYYNLPVHL